jgi:hypothetical protein
MMSRSWIHEAAITLASLGCLLGACTEKTPCDNGQELRDDGWCWNVDAAVTSADAAAVGAGSEAGAASAFGQVCTTTDECVLPTVYCAVEPGQSVGFCTAFGCDLDASVCPSGWGCMDMTPYGLPEHMCSPGS